MESGKAVGWDWDIKSGKDSWFGDLKSMFGIQSDTFVGRVEDFHRRIHPQDREGVAKAVKDAMNGHQLYAAEFRILWPDGTVRWVAAKGTFYYAKNGTPERMLGMAADITERKLAEEVLASVSRRLIEAHEEERTWIARELHDDVTQRLALLAVNLDALSQGPPASAVELERRISKERDLVSELERDVQALSHRLHSSKLEYLGLGAAARGFCKEFSERHNVEVQLHCENIPRNLRPEISLCLFRVLQEAVQNAMKYSGTRRFVATLEGTSSEIHLRVQDSGIGFDPADAINGHGLGLISMRERLKLVDGKLSIESRPQMGTLVNATVPLNTGVMSAGV
jgi:PAS domain S-box-containing protein